MEREKKIGIITFHRADNYGAVLQNYALISELKKKPSICPFTIDYRCSYLEMPYTKAPFDVKSGKIWQRLINGIRRMTKLRRYHRLRESFESFRVNYLNLTSSYDKDQLSMIENDFDVFVTGSDQVWNDNITGGDTTFSLDFVENKRKISYAASAGAIECMGENTRNKLCKIDAISVREENLHGFIESELKHKVELVCDPVFLLTPEEWNFILPKERLIKDKYIFTYSVSEKTDEIIQIAKKIAVEKGYKIAHLDHSIKYGVRGINLYGLSPLDFVRVIRDAEMVIVSSFHAVAFSIIFNKNFFVVPAKKTGSRIDGLLKIAKLENRLFDSNRFTNLDNTPEYEYSDELKELISSSKLFIDNNIVNYNCD